MSPKRHLLSQQARTILDELGVGLYYVDGGIVFMGDATGGPYAPASMESVEEACAAVRSARDFRNTGHRLEVFLETLDAGQGLDLRSAAWAKKSDPAPAASVLRLLGEPAPASLLDDRTAELVRWEQIQTELDPERGRGARRSRARMRGF